jgi:hypothetical protein
MDSISKAKARSPAARYSSLLMAATARCWICGFGAARVQLPEDMTALPLMVRGRATQVITPVVDFVLGRPDVDPKRIAIQGISQGGYWVPRALAFEKRIAAGIADPGVVDVSTSWTETLPKPLLALLKAGRKTQFDEYLAKGLDPRNRATLSFRMRPFGFQSYFDTYTAVLDDNLRAAPTGFNVLYSLHLRSMRLTGRDNRSSRTISRLVLRSWWSFLKLMVLTYIANLKAQVFGICACLTGWTKHLFELLPASEYTGNQTIDAHKL